MRMKILVTILIRVSLDSPVGPTENVAVFVTRTGQIPTMAVTTVGSTVGGTGGNTVDGMAILGIMVIVTINVAIGIVRRAIMAKVPRISILGGDNDLPL